MKSLECLTPEAVSLLHHHQLLHPLVKAEVIENELDGIELSDEEREQTLRGLWAQQNISNEEEFRAWLERKGMDKEELVAKLTNPIRLATYCKQKYGHRAEIRFLERKQSLDQVVYSLIRVRDPFQARELYLQIAEGESDFASTAARYSEGREKLTRGIVGPVPLIQAHPKLVDVLRSSKPGELREPVQIEDWNLIVRLESYQPAILDANMEQTMAQELFAEWVEEEVARTLRNLPRVPSPSATSGNA